MVDPSVILKLFEKFYEPNNDKYGTVVFDIGLSGLLCCTWHRLEMGAMY